MVLLATIVTLAAVWFTGTVERYENAFYSCLLFISGGAIGAFASIDLFFFYAFHELALIPTFLLIGIWGSGNRVAAAWKITIYLAIGSFILLLGLILLYQSFPASVRSFDIRALTAAACLGQIACGCATPYLSGVAYWFWNSYLTLSIPHLGAGSLCVGPGASGNVACGSVKKIWVVRSFAAGYSLVTGGRASVDRSSRGAAAREHHLRWPGHDRSETARLDVGLLERDAHGLHFSRNRQRHYPSTTGAVVLMFAHGLSIALLFALTGELRKRTGTLAFDELGGLGRVMPFAGLAFGFGVFAAIGLPGFANFAGEIMIFFGAFKNGWKMDRFHIFQIATVLALWGVVISTVYMLRAYRKTFMGS